MLDYWRNVTKSKEEKRQETLNAYLDGALGQEKAKRVESDLAQDEGLRAELDQMRLMQQQMGQLPQCRVRRNFTLDLALYGRPQREPLIQAYPVLRTATVFAAFFFIFALAASLFLNGMSGMSYAEPAAMQAESREEMIAEAVVEEPAEAEMMSAGPMDEAVGEAIISEEMAVQPRSVTTEDGMTADAAMVITESIVEAEEEAIVVEETGVESDFEMPIDEAASAPEPLDKESETGIRMEGAPAAEAPKAVSPVEDAALTVMPTMTAVATEVAEIAVEQQVLPRAVVTEPAMQPAPRSTKVAIVTEDELASISEIQTPRDEGSFLADSMGLIVLLFGISFAILIVLTLMARRRF